MSNFFDMLAASAESKKSDSLKNLLEIAEILYKKLLLKANRQGMYDELGQDVMLPVQKYIYQKLFQQYLQEKEIQDSKAITALQNQWSDYLLVAAQALPRKDQEYLGNIDTSLMAYTGE